VGLAGSAMGNGEESDSVTVSRCSGGGEIECGTNTDDSFPQLVCLLFPCQ